jgi:hypothetical protein
LHTWTFRESPRDCGRSNSQLIKCWVYNTTWKVKEKIGACLWRKAVNPVELVVCYHANPTKKSKQNMFIPEKLASYTFTIMLFYSKGGVHFLPRLLVICLTPRNELLRPHHVSTPGTIQREEGFGLISLQILQNKFIHFVTSSIFKGG